jgi:hypothetical protein
MTLDMYSCLFDDEIRSATTASAVMGRRGLNPGTTDFESDRNPLGTLAIRRSVLGCLIQGDPADQRFSPLCGTNVPHELPVDSVS